MPLTPEDVQAIGQLLDQRVAAHDQAMLAQIEARLQAQERRRRRFWAWVIWVTVLLTLASSVALWRWSKQALAPYLGQLSGLQQQLRALQVEGEQTRTAYAELLREQPRLQQEHREAVAASGYQSQQSQAQFDAQLLAKLLAFYTKSREAQTQAAKPGMGADDDEAAIANLTSTLSDASGMLMQLVLHESDPAHVGSVEKLTQQDAASHATPIAPVPTAPLVTPGAAPAKPVAPPPR